jgi:hypothetical protein
MDPALTRLTLPGLTERVCSVLQLEQESVRAPSKARVPEARGIICYIAPRDLGYKGKDVG